MSDLEEKLEQGISAAQAGHKKKARTLLAEVVEADEGQLEAWLWLSQVVDSLEEKSICLENVLALDPEHEFAREALTTVQAAQAELDKSVYTPEEPPPATITPPKPVTAVITAQSPYPEDEFDNEWLCPYCLAPTQSAAKSCPACHRPLVLSSRVKEERTAWLWRGFFFQIWLAMMIFAAGSAAYMILPRLNGLPHALEFFPLYFGLPTEQPEALNQAMLALFPRWLFWSLVIALLYTLALAGVLLLRLPYGNIVYLVSAGLIFCLGLLFTLLFYDSAPGLGLIVLTLITGAVQLLVTLNLWNDFTFKESRLRLRADRDAKGHPTLFISARKYSKLGMWGLAALHLRKAIALNPHQPAYHLALALAYLNLNRPGQAETSLAEAERLDPHAPEIGALRLRLGENDKREM